MSDNKLHTFHIPVMGTGFTLDTPIKVAKYGISSVISLVDDILIEQVREYYCNLFNEDFVPIKSNEPDVRAKRITEYLNILNRIVNKQFDELKNSLFEEGSEITKYFELLPETAEIKQLYLEMLSLEDSQEKKDMQEQLRKAIAPGAIDVNIMTKLDTDTYSNGQTNPPEFSDAMTAFRGFANSDLHSSMVFSAGINRKLYSYIDNFEDFFPDETGYLKKKIALKVSDFRSALTQARMLAKKGLWVSDFKIESGLNCGGHAFSTRGYLMGPVLEEFKQRREELVATMHRDYTKALQKMDRATFDKAHEVEITVQGGIGTSKENNFLHGYYKVDRTGWCTPFLLVPDAVSIEDETMNRLIKAGEDDIILSDASPMNIPFYTLRNSLSEEEKNRRITENNPGVICKKRYLVVNTDFHKVPLCTASRRYQKLKLEKIDHSDLPEEEAEKERAFTLAKACICHELGGSILAKLGIEKKNAPPPAVCPGPNLAYFSRTYSLKEMVDHIYGRIDLLGSVQRPNLFFNELKIYLNYYKEEILKSLPSLTALQRKNFNTFYANLKEGIQYYRDLLKHLTGVLKQSEAMSQELNQLEERLDEFVAAHPVSSPAELTSAT